MDDIHYICPLDVYTIYIYIYIYISVVNVLKLIKLIIFRVKN